MAEQPDNSREKQKSDIEQRRYNMTLSEKVYELFKPMFLTFYVGLPFLAVYSVKPLSSYLGIGEIPEDVTIGAGAAASVMAGIDLTVRYFRGKWPFTSIDKNVWQPTLWINEKRGPILEQGTSLLISPLVKKVLDEEGKPLSIPGTQQELDMTLRFTTEAGYQGSIAVQAIYQIRDPYIFHWIAEGRVGKLDGLISGKLSERIGDIVANKITKSDYVDDVVKKLNGKGSMFELTGCETLNISISDPTYDPESEKIRLIPIKAEKDAEATERMAEATKKNYATYLEIARDIYKLDKSTPLSSLFMKLITMDNTQQVAESGKATIVSIDTPIPMFQVQPKNPTSDDSPDGPNLKYHSGEPEEE
ncbi:hypothetical protein HYV88_01710 [Candidatus Woesearchaeota archaeon]|nr:hypothetical protein [Candidatus Woesearchaeota archaeon]